MTIYTVYITRVSGTQFAIARGTQRATWTRRPCLGGRLEDPVEGEAGSHVADRAVRGHYRFRTPPGQSEERVVAVLETGAPALHDGIGDLVAHGVRKPVLLLVGRATAQPGLLLLFWSQGCVTDTGDQEGQPHREDHEHQQCVPQHLARAGLSRSEPPPAGRAHPPAGRRRRVYRATGQDTGTRSATVPVTERSPQACPRTPARRDPRRRVCASGCTRAQRRCRWTNPGTCRGCPRAVPTAPSSACPGDCPAPGVRARGRRPRATAGGSTQGHRPCS